MNVLVTGAGGYIGRVVARDLITYKHRVRAVDMRPMTDELQDTQTFDLNDYETLHKTVKGRDGIAHLAWPMHPYENYTPADHSDLGAGVGILYHLLKTAVDCGVKRFVFQSTINITASDWDRWRLTEDALPRPGLGGYTLGKTLAEEVCRAFAREHDITVAVLRVGGVYTLEESGYEFAAPDQHGIPSSCVERRDIAQAYHLALTRDLPSRFEIFHIFHTRPGDRFPTSKARDILGFEPKYNFENLYLRR
jgi:nucleoside-diphosphate-sugar epimerase